MAKKIFMTDDQIAAFLADAKAKLTEEGSELKKRKFSTDTSREVVFKFRVNDDDDGRKAKLLFTPTAWAKMCTLVMQYTTEIEWHGTVTRLDDTSFLVNDVLVFPHVVAAANTTSDQMAYEEWLDSLDDDTFNALRFHGHSHVNMDSAPSSVDMAYRNNVLKKFWNQPDGADFFYIFLITNKRGEVSAQIFDIKNNALYTNSSSRKDIDIDVLCDGCDTTMADFMKEARKVAQPAGYAQAAPTYPAAQPLKLTPLAQFPSSVVVSATSSPYYDVAQDQDYPDYYSYSQRVSNKAKARYGKQIAMFDS